MPFINRTSIGYSGHIRHIGQSIGLETLACEFKEVFLQLNCWKKELDAILKTRTITHSYDQCVRKSLRYYISKYIPKYVSSMSRTRVEDKKASLYFGVDDNGIVIGFPVQKKITKDEFHAMIINSLSNGNTRGIAAGAECSDVHSMYIDKIETRIIDLECTETLHDLDASIKSVRDKKKRYDSHMSIYYRKMDKWYQKVEFYAQALETIGNDPPRRKAFLDFCIKNDAPNEIIAIIKGSTELKFPVGVHKRKVDKNGMDHWITYFKDTKIEEVTAIRPEKPTLKEPDTNAFSQLSNMGLMAGHWKNAHYQMIEVILPTNIYSATWIEYKKDGEWISRVRAKKSSGDPCCLIVS